MKRFLLMCLAGAAPLLAAENRRLVWADEFDQLDGSAPNAANWVFDLGGKGWGNNELQTYTDRRENSRIENGALVIEARKETFTGVDKIKRSYTSARLKTLGKNAWRYGRIEARMKLPKGQGIWPAFWMMGSDVNEAGWPDCGEIDVMENVGKEPKVVHGTVHGPGYSGAGGIGHGYTNSVALADEFHVYGVEWEPSRIRWTFDEKVYFAITPDDLPAGKKWVYDKPHFILLNLAVGGHWPGKPDSSSIFPQRLEVDYVRVYGAP